MSAALEETRTFKIDDLIKALIPQWNELANSYNGFVKEKQPPADTTLEKAREYAACARELTGLIRPYCTPKPDDLPLSSLVDRGHDYHAYGPTYWHRNERAWARKGALDFWAAAQVEPAFGKLFLDYTLAREAADTGQEMAPVANNLFARIGDVFRGFSTDGHVNASLSTLGAYTRLGREVVAAFSRIRTSNETSARFQAVIACFQESYKEAVDNIGPATGLFRSMDAESITKQADMGRVKNYLYALVHMKEKGIIELDVPPKYNPESYAWYLYGDDPELTYSSTDRTDGYVDKDLAKKYDKILDSLGAVPVAGHLKNPNVRYGIKPSVPPDGYMRAFHEKRAHVLQQG